MRQAPIPENGVYCPVEHAVQDELCATEYCPAAQRLQFDVPPADEVPAGQIPHPVWLANANCPAGHRLHAVLAWLDT